MEQQKKLAVEIACIVHIPSIGCVNVQNNSLVFFNANGSKLVSIPITAEDLHNVFRKVTIFLSNYQNLPVKVKQKNDYMVIGRFPRIGVNRSIVIKLLSDIDIDESLYLT